MDELEYIMMSEVSQSQDKFCMVPLIYEVPSIDKFTEMKEEQWVPGAGGGE